MMDVYLRIQDGYKALVIPFAELQLREIMGHCASCKYNLI